jgi:hypothetical protein
VLLMVAEEFADDLESGMFWGKPTVTCLWPATDVFQ